MEIPDSDRVTITDLYNGVEIQIRAGRAWQDIAAGVFQVLFLIALCYIGIAGSFQDSTAIFGWVAVLVAVLFLTVKRALWLAKGVEIITVADGSLLIRRNGLLWIFNTEACPLEGARDFRVQREATYSGTRYHQEFIGRRGTIYFIREGRTYRFGDMLSEAEGNYIVQTLRDKKLIE